MSVLKKVLKPFLIRPRVEYYDRGLDQSVLFESDIFNLVTITQGSRPTLGEHLGPAIQDQDACQRNKPTGSAYLIRLSNFNMHGGPPTCSAAAFGSPAISLTGSETDVAPNQPAPPRTGIRSAAAATALPRAPTILDYALKVLQATVARNRSQLPRSCCEKLHVARKVRYCVPSYPPQ